jgi:hypothetical protein
VFPRRRPLTTPVEATLATVESLEFQITGCGRATPVPFSFTARMVSMEYSFTRTEEGPVTRRLITAGSVGLVQLLSMNRPASTKHATT